MTNPGKPTDKVVECAISLTLKWFT